MSERVDRGIKTTGENIVIDKRTGVITMNSYADKNKSELTKALSPVQLVAYKSAIQLQDNRQRSVTNSFVGPVGNQPEYYFRDNRRGSVMQRKLIENGNNKHTIQKKQSQMQQSPVLDDMDTPVQLLSYKSSWKSQEDKYQPNKVGSERIDGDAEWLAIVRFCNKIVIDHNKTVEENLNKAALAKGISFDDWKGSQNTEDNQEAQHLIPASFAHDLKIPYSWINSPQNGKMLIAGRKISLKAPKKYVAAKANKGKKPNRGIIHIEKGSAHPHYNKKVEEYITKYYKDNHLKKGDAISYAHFKAITDHLREIHKKYDTMVTAAGVSNANMSVDQLDLNQAVMAANPPAVAANHAVNAPLANKGYNPAYVGGLLTGGAGLIAGAVLGTKSGAVGGALLGGIGGAVVGGILGALGGAALGVLGKYKTQ